MSKKSRKVVDKNAINELLNEKGKDMLGEAFEGVGGVVPLGAINNMEGSYSKPTQTINETLPALGKEWSNLEKAEKILGKAISDLSKSAGRVDRDHQKTIEGLWKYVSNQLKKFKELVGDEVLSKLQ
tara:strand:- start:108 stop:488 length:381 start_codon:yes stop_codon:yes gene_type:complete